MRHLNPIGIMFALLAAFLPSASGAQDEDTFDRTPVDCVVVSSIDRTDVIDDQTILFYMRGNKIYRNYLPRKCPGLERNDRFSYQVTGGRLCDIDTVTVLEQWGSRLSSGFTCPLGEFHPIPLEEVEELELDSEGNRVNPNAVEVEAVELPDDAAEATGDGDPAVEASDEGSEN